LIKKIKSDLENFYNQIMSFSPERLKKYWYWILTDGDWKYLIENQVSNLEIWNELKINIYDREIKVKIIW
jgi:hypothetical protein